MSNYDLYKPGEKIIMVRRARPECNHNYSLLITNYSFQIFSLSLPRVFQTYGLVEH